MNPYELMSISVKFSLQANQDRPQEGNQVKIPVDPDAHHSAWYSHLIGNALRRYILLNAMAGVGTHRPPMIRVKTL